MLKWPPDVHKGDSLPHLSNSSSMQTRHSIIYHLSKDLLQVKLKSEAGRYRISLCPIYINPLRLGVFDVHSPPLLTFHRKLLSSRLQRSPRLKEVQPLQQPSIACFLLFWNIFYTSKNCTHILVALSGATE